MKMGGARGRSLTNLVQGYAVLAVLEKGLDGLLLLPRGGDGPTEQLLPHPPKQGGLKFLRRGHLSLEHLHHLHHGQLTRHHLQDLLHHAQVT